MTEEIAAPPPHRLLHWLRHIAIVAFFLGFGAMLVGIGSLLITGNHPATRDVVSFWSAGRLVFARANPYDATTITALERSVGFSPKAAVLIMRNPPYALPLVLPLGAFQLRAASLVWSLILMTILVLSIHLFWIAYGRPANRIHLFAFTFSPALACIMSGQTSLFALLGLVLFLRFHRERSFAAGMALWLCALKPHLFLPFAVVVLLWAVFTRSYRLLAGSALAVAATSAFATWLIPGVWGDYSRMMHSPLVQAEFVPCLSYQLRALHPQAAWLQYAPAFAGCCWASWFYLRRRHTWNWIEDGALLMLVSLVVGPYSWLTDHAVLIPALLVGLYRATTRAQLALLGLASLLIEIAQFSGVSMHSSVFILLPLYWLAWYLFTTRQPRENGAPLAALAQEPLLHSL